MCVGWKFPLFGDAHTKKSLLIVRAIDVGIGVLLEPGL